MSLTVKYLEKQEGTLSKTAHAWLGGLVKSEITGYTGYSCSAAHDTDDGSWTCTGNTADRYMELRYTTSVACVTNHKIYIRATMSTTSADSDNLLLAIYGSTSGADEVTLKSTPASGVDYVLSGVFTLTAAYTGNILLLFRLTRAASTNTVVCKITDWQSINLTDQFGAGDEPLLAELDAFFLWRSELMTQKNWRAYHSLGYGDGLYFASKIADHGLEYNDVVGYTYTSGVDYKYVSPVYVLNDDWIITQGWTLDGMAPHPSFDDNNDFFYWTKADVTNRLAARSLRLHMREDIDAYAGMTFYCDSDWQPEIGMTLMIQDGTDWLFSGHVSSIHRAWHADATWTAQCTVSSMLSVLQWSVYPYDQSEMTNAGLETTQDYLHFLFGLISGYPTYNVGGQPMWLGAIDYGVDAVSIPEPEYKTLHEMMSSISTAAGLSILVTGDSRVKIISATREPVTSHTITGDGTEDVQNPQYSEDISSYGNLIVVRGGYDTEGVPVRLLGGATTPPMTNDVYGGYANKAIIVSDSAASDSDSALAAANAAFYRHSAVMPGTLTFTTQDTDYRPGDLIEVDLDEIGIEGKTMLIESVEIYDVDGNNLMANISCSNRSADTFTPTPNKGDTAYMSDVSSKVTSSVAAVTQEAGDLDVLLSGTTSNGTLSQTAEGKYIKHGSMLFFWLTITVASVTSAPTGNLVVLGLPYNNSLTVPAGGCMANMTKLNVQSGYLGVVANIPADDNAVYFYNIRDDNTMTALTGADIKAGTVISVSGHYIAGTDLR